MNKTRTIIIDGIEIQTSLTGVEIAGLVQRNKELEQQVKKQKEVIDKINDLLSDEFLEVIDRNTLLDILKGVSDNE